MWIETGQSPSQVIVQTGQNYIIIFGPGSACFTYCAILLTVNVAVWVSSSTGDNKASSLKHVMVSILFDVVCTCCGTISSYLELYNDKDISIVAWVSG